MHVQIIANVSPRVSFSWQECKESQDILYWIQQSLINYIVADNQLILKTESKDLEYVPTFFSIHKHTIWVVNNNVM